VPEDEYFYELQRASKNMIIWGGNYFNLPPTPCFICWDKVQPENFTMAMCEFAWASFKSPAKIYKQRIVGADIERIHPTQKPVALYEWLLTNYAKQGDKILDTHLGSGSHAIACNNLGFELTACELDKDYFDASVKRITQANKQIRMFA
jgi:site-specific DNA-methyltransferase (adenine-specific)